MAAAAVSPELALIDPELRAHALSGLPRLEPFDFLRFSGEPRRHPDLELFGFLADLEEVERRERLPPVWVAALAYAGFTLARTVVVDLLIVLTIAVAVALTQVS